MGAWRPTQVQDTQVLLIHPIAENDLVLNAFLSIRCAWLLSPATVRSRARVQHAMKQQTEPQTAQRQISKATMCTTTKG